MAYVTEENLTDVVAERWASIADPRLKQVMQALIRHLHGFVRDIEPTQCEWMAAIEWLTRTGQMCGDKRQEFILTSDVLGVSMLVDAINHRQASGATPSTVEGPFHLPAATEVANGANLTEQAPGTPCILSGTVRGTDGRPIAGAILDLWQTDGEGLYDAQRPEVEGAWMRGVYRSQPDGSFIIRTVAPLGYTIPMDGTVGELIRRTEVSHMRPAHIHFAIDAPGFRGVVTHLFERGGQYLDTDAVFAVKEPLIVDFRKQPPGRAPNGETIEEPWYLVEYDFVLDRKAPAAAA